MLSTPSPLRSQPCLSAYADNWSWTLQEVIGHQVAMTNTCHFDWSETLFWATASSDARHISDPSPLLTKSSDIYRLMIEATSCITRAAEISYIVLRMDYVVLARLTGMSHSLDVKEHLILSSVLPAALDAAETRPLSGEQTNFGQRWPLIMNSGS